MLRTLTLTALAVALPIAARAQVAIMPIDATNLTDGEAAAIGAVLADAYAREGGAPVIAPSQSREALIAVGDARVAAAQLGATELVRCSAVRLAAKVALTCTRYDAEGREIFEAEMTAASLDDVGVAATRIARALIDQRSTTDVRDHRTVTREESRERNRTFVEKVMGIKGSVTAIMARGVRYDPGVSLQFDGRLEAERYFIEFGAGTLLPSHGDRRNYGSLFAEIGASRYLTDGEIAPYVGAGLSPRIAFDSVEGGIGIAPYAQVGVMLMRSSSSRLYFDLRVAQNVMGFAKSDSGYYDATSGTWVNATSDTIYPTEVGLLFGVGW